MKGKGLDNEINYMMNNKIKTMRKRIPLNIRLRINFQCEWLTMNINPDRPATEEEIHKAEEWAEKMEKLTIADIKEWEANGRPGALG